MDDLQPRWIDGALFKLLEETLSDASSAEERLEEGYIEGQALLDVNESCEVALEALRKAPTPVRVKADGLAIPRLGIQEVVPFYIPSEKDLAGMAETLWFAVSDEDFSDFCTRFGENLHREILKSMGGNPNPFPAVILSSSSEEPFPCPFCGGAPQFSECVDYVKLFCTSCGVSSPEDRTSTKPREEIRRDLVRWWNRRAPIKRG